MSAVERPAEEAVRWVSVRDLPDIARALLGERRDGRDVVPERVADRVSKLAAAWAKHGFTATTVGPWTELPPETAAVLVAAGLTPESLDRQVVTVRGATTTLWRAVLDGLLTGEDAVERANKAVEDAAAGVQRTEATGPFTPAGPAPAAADGGEARRPASGPVAPATFSHPATETPAERAEQRRAMPSQSPFQP